MDVSADARVAGAVGYWYGSPAWMLMFLMASPLHRDTPTFTWMGVGSSCSCPAEVALGGPGAGASCAPPAGPGAAVTGTICTPPAAPGAAGAGAGPACGWIAMGAAARTWLLPRTINATTKRPIILPDPSEAGHAPARRVGPTRKYPVLLPGPGLYF